MSHKERDEDRALFLAIKKTSLALSLIHKSPALLPGIFFELFPPLVIFLSIHRIPPLKSKAPIQSGPAG